MGSGMEGAAGSCVHVNDLLEAQGELTLRLDVKVIYSCLYTFVFIGGLLGNGLLIQNIVKRRSYSVPNVFLMNLAVSDLLLCMTSVPVTPVLAFLKKWLFGRLMCKLVPLSQATSVLLSSYSLSFIALDRYRNIVTVTKVPWTLRHAISLMVLTWILSLAISAPLFISQELESIQIQNITLCGKFCGEYKWPDGKLKTIYGLILLAVQLLIPVSMMCFCYWKILLKVRQDWIVREGSYLTEAQQAQASVRKRRVMYVLILMVVAYVCSWLPLTFINLLRDFDIIIPFIEQNLYFNLLNVHALAMLSIIWNPLLYFWMSKRHRRALKHDMMYRFTNSRRDNPQMGVLQRCAPDPSVTTVVFKRSLAGQHNQLPHSNQTLNKGRATSLIPVPVYRRGTLADPTCPQQEEALQKIQASCFLLVPLMPTLQSSSKSNSRTRSNLRNSNYNRGKFPVRKKAYKCISSEAKPKKTTGIFSRNQMKTAKSYSNALNNETGTSRQTPK